MKFFLVFTLFIICTGMSSAQYLASPDMVSASTLALGRTQTLRPNGIYGLFSNPALLKDSQDGRVIEIGLAHTGDVGETLSLFNSLTGSTTFPVSKINDYARERLPHFPFGFSINGPVIVGLVNKGFGAAVFTHIFSTSSITRTLRIANLNFEVVGIAGYGITLIDTYAVKLDIGFSGKAWFSYVAHTAYETSPPNPFPAYRTDIDMNEKTIMAGGLNAGVVFRYKSFLGIGLSVQDAFSMGNVTALTNENILAPVHIPFNGYIGTTVQNISLGFSFHILDTAFMDLQLYLEYRDIYTMLLYQGLAVPRDITLNICAGLEAAINTFVFIRAGFTDMMPTAGIGLEFAKFGCDFTYFNEESGYAVGQKPLAGFAVDFKFKF